MKKVLIAILACSALLVGTTACGTTNNTTSSTNSTTETTSSVVSQVTNPDYQKPENISTADDAKKALEAGNKAYKDGNIDITATNADRTDLSENGQKPYAVVITCSDSRVPPELIFNSGLGELFTIRTAGNVVADFETGSVEYGVDHLGAPLVVVIQNAVLLPVQLKDMRKDTLKILFTIFFHLWNKQDKMQKVKMRLLL